MSISLPEISQEVFANRRDRLAKKMGRYAIAIVVNPPVPAQMEDLYFPYQPNRDFYYLTGFTEPNAVAVIIPTEASHDLILFNEPFDPMQAQWEGARAGQEGARRDFGAAESYPIAELEARMPELLGYFNSIYFPTHSAINLAPAIHRWTTQLADHPRERIKHPITFHDLHHYLAKWRLVKDRSELACMRYAADVSILAHEQAMKLAKPGLNEANLHAKLIQVFIEHQCTLPAYAPIVASGKNACTLHYSKNNDRIGENDLILIDAGASFSHYAADITRTFPANGRFSAEQRAIYDIVLAAQLAAFDTIRPGHAWTEAQEVIVKIITQGLVDLKILKGDVDNLIEKQAYKPFYMHRSGHWLGLATHDAGNYYDEDLQSCHLTPGIVTTVEPGIYIHENNESVDAKWRGIGIRIEDDLLITETGYENLTGKLVKTVEDIEAVMRDP